MLRCDRCGRPADREIHQEINGQTKKMHLCSSCFQEFLAQGGLSTWLNEVSPTIPFTAVAEPLRLFRPAGGACPHCGTTYQSFTTTGLLGCKHCYKAFEDLLEREVLPRLQRGPRYRGRAYGQTSKAAGVQEVYDDGSGLLTLPNQPSHNLVHERGTLVDQLKLVLKEAIENEEYERAARIRDKIRELDSNHAQQPKGGEGA